MKQTQEEIKGFLDDVPTSPSYRKLCANFLHPFRSWPGDREFDKESAQRYAKNRYEESSSTNTFYAVTKRVVKRVEKGLTLKERGK